MRRKRQPRIRSTNQADSTTTPSKRARNNISRLKRKMMESMMMKLSSREFPITSRTSSLIRFSLESSMATSFTR